MIRPELWFPVDGYGDRYEVSDHGNVPSIRADGSVYRYLCWTICTKGYAQVRFYWRGRRYQPMVHQLVAQAFLGPAPDDGAYDVHHKDTKRTHNWADNLEYVPHKEHWRRTRRRTRVLERAA